MRERGKKNYLNNKTQSNKQQTTIKKKEKQIVYNQLYIQQYQQSSVNSNSFIKSDFL